MQLRKKMFKFFKKQFGRFNKCGSAVALSRKGTVNVGNIHLDNVGNFSVSDSIFFHKFFSFHKLQPLNILTITSLNNSIVNTNNQ